jgi:DNA gyrase/topoisomerase IV subunit A
MKKIKSKYTKKYTFTYTQLQKLIQEKVNIMQDITLAIVAMQLRDKYDFGTKRVQRVLEGIAETIENINKGIISVEDVFGVVEDELKLTAKREGVKYPTRRKNETNTKDPL